MWISRESVGLTKADKWQGFGIHNVACLKGWRHLASSHDRKYMLMAWFLYSGPTWFNTDWKSSTTTRPSIKGKYEWQTHACCDNHSAPFLSHFCFFCHQTGDCEKVGFEVEEHRLVDTAAHCTFVGRTNVIQYDGKVTAEEFWAGDSGGSWSVLIKTYSFWCFPVNWRKWLWPRSCCKIPNKQHTSESISSSLFFSFLLDPW